jgi:hypothetical protein
VVSIFDAGLDGHGPGIGDAGQLERCVHLVDQLFVGEVVRNEPTEDPLHPFGLLRVPGFDLRPILFGLQDDDGLHHGEGRWVRGGIGAAGLAHDGFDLGEAADDAVLQLKKLLRFRDRDARQGGGHEQESPFIEGRHEFVTQLLEDRDGNRDHGEGGGDDKPFPAQAPRADGLIQADEHAADGVCLFGINRSHDDPVHQAAEPERTKRELLHMNEEQQQDRPERDGEDCGSDHRKVLHVRQRFEETPFLRFQRENGNE